MIEFFKNLFKKKEKTIRLPNKEKIEHYIKDDDIEIFVNRDKGVIRIEAPENKKLSQDDIIEICREFYEE